MKSFFMAISLLVSVFFTAGTALSYDCYDRAPVPARSQHQKVQCKEKQPCLSPCKQCDRSGVQNPFHYDTCDRPVVRSVSYTYRNDCGAKKRAPRYKAARYTAPRHITYQCQTAYTEKIEQVATVQCKLCGTRYLKGVDHYCNKVQCGQRVQKQPERIGYQCDTVQRNTYGMQYPERTKYNCGETRCKSCCSTCCLPTDKSNCCNSRIPCQKDCFHKNPCRNEVGRCAPQNCNTSRGETMGTKWHKWFKNQQQRI